MPYAVVNGVRLHYLQVGDTGVREPEHLVMLHGLASSLAFWYFQYAQEFANRFRVTLLDLRGHGRSDMPPSGYTPDELSRDVDGLLDHLGIQRAHFVAHSFGGLVALHHACRHPTRVHSLVLVDSYVHDLGIGRPLQAWTQGQKLRQVLERHDIDLDTEDPQFGLKLLGVMARLRLSEDPVPPDLLRLLGPVMEKFGRHACAQWLKLLETTAAMDEFVDGKRLRHEEIRRLDFPICAIYGEASHALSTGNELLGVWRDAEFRLVRRAGHFFPVSRTGELIARCNQFWDRCGDSGRRVRRPSDTKAYFQSDRFYSIDDGWYCSLREGGRLGPFGSHDEAAQHLAATLGTMRTS